MSEFLVTSAFPYCKGCGHHLVVRNTVRALEALENVRPLDVVFATDIGCLGIVDRALASHTIHGLHGRSAALGAGIAMGLSRDKKVIVFIGDGGATIGLQHLMEAARLNVNMTVVVHNNFLYGMTGGQPSGLTPCGFNTVITPDGCMLTHYDLCQLTHSAGAAYTCRVIGQGNFSDAIRKGLEVEGFALVEVLELCPSHGVKRNPGMRLKALAQEVGYELGTWRGNYRPAFHLAHREDLPSLLEVKGVETRFASPLDGRATVVLGGSAGEGVQRAAEILAQAAMASGLHATKKGSYPVTVGVGFSTAELVLSRDPIAYHGIARPDAVIAVSADGLQHNLERIQKMDRGTVWLDASLDAPTTGAEVQVKDFRGQAGPRNAALYGLLTFARETGIVSPEALVEAVKESPIGKHIPVELLE
jgi:pyruvate/2-oxoacid:ferredoxin oxidoreductase beta subunit/Pyruvate/2-oxoacid:ferredoxin oxidoreductase gamma subunit